MNQGISAVAVPMIFVPGGECLMGSTREEIERCVAYWSERLVDASFTTDKFRTWIEKEYPAHSRPLRPYEISKYPITNAEYEVFAAATGARVPDSLRLDEPPTHPVWDVRFEEAEAFARWMGRGHRLPTEAEWEFAARGLSRREYPYGDEFSADRANTIEAGIGKTTPVDRYERWASPFGLCDMAGNVEEWVDARYAPYPGGRFIADDLVDALGAEYRVLRGGSFARGGDLSRCARRHGRYPSDLYRYTGFRIAYDAERGGENT